MSPRAPGAVKDGFKPVSRNEMTGFINSVVSAERRWIAEQMSQNFAQYHQLMLAHGAYTNRGLRALAQKFGSAPPVTLWSRVTGWFARKAAPVPPAAPAPAEGTPEPQPEPATLVVMQGVPDDAVAETEH